ncbi:MAG: HAD-IA family hydrolase [Candidatus Caenarcaniphilales bacterium]|jgi:HAD superfamily hydrolase (TIGR01549 family)|nr:HAD-IA family hydrolase [Candidatus Caenarcaniphilales bacterium]
MAKIQNIKAIILDKDGVFVDFHSLWMRIIAYRAQLIAEKASNTSEMLVAIRAACIRAMGIDEELETIDAYGPCSLPADHVRTSLATALFLTKNSTEGDFTFKEAFSIVDQSMKEGFEALNVVDLSQALEGSLEKIKDIKASGFELAVYTSDSLENTKATLDKFEIAGNFSQIAAGEFKTSKNYSELCAKLNLKAEETLLVTDSPNDIKAAKESGAKAILVLSGIVDQSSNLSNLNADMIIDSLADLNLDLIENSKKKALA